MSQLNGWRGAAFTFLVAVAAGCSEEGPAAVADAAPQSSLLRASPDVSMIAEYRSGLSSVLSVGWTSAWIGPPGGSLRLQGFEIVVPPGAVTQYTLFSIKLPLDVLSLRRAIAEFEPHGVRFAAPVTLRLPYRGTTAENETPAALWWSGGGWIRYPTTLRSDGRIETTTTHFSLFGTEDPERGITPVGG